MRIFAALLATLAVTVSTVCADQTFRIVELNGNQAYRFNMSNLGFTELQDDPMLNVTIGEKLTFRLETIMKIDPTNGEDFKSHFHGTYAFGLTHDYFEVQNFRSLERGNFQCSSSCSLANDGKACYTTNIADPCIVTWIATPPKDGETDFAGQPARTFYRSNVSTTVSGPIQYKPASTTQTTATTTPTTTSTTTSTPTTQTSTTPKPTSTGGNNGAAAIVPATAAGAVVLIIATINALFA